MGHLIELLGFTYNLYVHIKRITESVHWASSHKGYTGTSVRDQSYRR